MRGLRVVLADDTALFRQGMAKLLTNAGVEVVAEAADAVALLEAVVRWEPDVAVVDVRMPPTGTDEGYGPLPGSAATTPPRRCSSSPRSSNRHIWSTCSPAVRAGRVPAEGPGAARPRVRLALQRVASGGSAMDPEVVSELFARRHAHEPLSTLTGREGRSSS